MKYEPWSSSDSWESSCGLLEAMIASPFCVSFATELYVKSAAGAAPFTRAKAPLWHASSTTRVRAVGQGAQAIAQRAEGQVVAAEVDGGRPGVPRVIEDDLGLLAARGVLACPGAEGVERGDDLGGDGVEEHLDVARVEVAELAQDLGHAQGVVLGEMKRLLSRAARVAADDHGVGVGVGSRGEGRGNGGAVGAGGRRGGQEGRRGESGEEGGKEGRQAGHRGVFRGV